MDDKEEVLDNTDELLDQVEERARGLVFSQLKSLTWKTANFWLFAGNLQKSVQVLRDIEYLRTYDMPQFPPD